MRSFFVIFVADFLLPFYYLLISYYRLFTVLTASMSPIPEQKPTIPIPIKSDNYRLTRLISFCSVLPCSAVAGPSLSPLVHSPFLLCSDK